MQSPYFTGAVNSGRPGFHVTHAADSGGAVSEIYLYDDIGPAWLGMIDAKTVIDSLEKIGGGPVTVRINSRGGDAAEGIAIYNAIRRYQKATIAIDGLAASAASLAAMGGKSVWIADNAILMIHNAWTFAYGDIQVLRKAAEVLETFDESIRIAYADKTGLDENTLAQMMDSETWLSAKEAKEQGFADEIGDAMAIEKPAAKALWYHGEREDRNRFRDGSFGSLNLLERTVTLKRRQLGL